MSAELDDVLAEVKAGKVAPLYLLWGEEFLVRKGRGRAGEGAGAGAAAA